jgi:hypothetical protein
MTLQDREQQRLHRTDPQPPPTPPSPLPKLLFWIILAIAIGYAVHWVITPYGAQ